MLYGRFLAAHFPWLTVGSSLYESGMGSLLLLYRRAPMMSILMGFELTLDYYPRAVS